MYSLQSLWTIARENLNVTVLIFANNAYQVLIDELMRSADALPIARAKPLLRLDDPLINWADLSRSLGINSIRVENKQDLKSALEYNIYSKGPNLIEIATC